MPGPTPGSVPDDKPGLFAAWPVTGSGRHICRVFMMQAAAAEKNSAVLQPEQAALPDQNHAINFQQTGRQYDFRHFFRTIQDFQRGNRSGEIDKYGFPGGRPNRQLDENSAVRSVPSREWDGKCMGNFLILILGLGQGFGCIDNMDDNAVPPGSKIRLRQVDSVLSFRFFPARPPRISALTVLP